MQKAYVKGIYYLLKGTKAITLFMLASSKLQTIQHDVDDALADSVLAALVADDIYYFETWEGTGTAVVRFRDLDESYRLYRDCMKDSIESKNDFYGNIRYSLLIPVNEASSVLTPRRVNFRQCVLAYFLSQRAQILRKSHLVLGVGHIQLILQREPCGDIGDVMLDDSLKTVNGLIDFCLKRLALFHLVIQRQHFLRNVAGEGGDPAVQQPLFLLLV